MASTTSLAAKELKEELRRRNSERVLRAKAESRFLKEMGARHTDPYGSYIVDRSLGDAGDPVDSSTAIEEGSYQGYNQQQFSQQQSTTPSKGGVLSGQGLDRLVAIHEQVAAEHERNVMQREAAQSAARSLGRASTSNMGIVVSDAERFVEFTSRVEGCLAFAVCESQGGASVWTANTDGSLTIRNGTTLAAVVEIPRRADNTTPSIFYPTTDGYVWVGYTDGTVQIYDGNVFVLITEGRFHDDEVSAFVQMHDRRIVSGSRDGSLVRWENEEKNFEAMSRVLLSDAASASVSMTESYSKRRPANEGVSCLATQGFEIFVGCSFTGHLVAIHAQDEVQLGVFSEQYSEGSDCTCLAVADGYLFSGYASSRIFVWNIESRRCLHTVSLHSIPVAFIGDFPNRPVNFATITNRLWIALEDSTVQVWSTQADERFSADLAITAFTASSEAQLRSLQTATSWDTMRAISIGSNGISKVWASLNSIGRKARIDTIANLSSVLKHDAIQLGRIGATVQLFRQRQDRRVTQLAEMMLRSNREAIMRAAYHKWLAYLSTKANDRHVSAVCRSLTVLGPNSNLMFRYVSKWYRWMAQRRKISNSHKYAVALKPVQTERVQLLYLHRLKQFHATMRNYKNLEAIIALFAKNSRENLMRAVYFKWIEFRRRKRRNARLSVIANQLAESSHLTCLRRYYAHWYTVRAQKMFLLKLGVQTLQSMHRLNEANLMRDTFRKMMLYASRQRKIKALQEQTRAHEVRTLMRSYYFKWLRFVHVSNEERTMAKVRDRRLVLDRYRAEHAELAVLIKKKLAVDKVHLDIAEVNTDITKNQQGYEDAVATLAKLQETLEALRASRLSATESTKDQLVRLMARLKAKTLNFYSDTPLFLQIRERFKAGGQPIIVRHFLESHQNVKRVVVDVTKRPHLGTTEKWPLSQAMIEKLPTHQLTPIHNAIKVMVLCFDIMSRETRDSIETDVEIVTNGEILMAMIDVCVAHRKKMMRSVTPTTGARSSTPTSSAGVRSGTPVRTTVAGRSTTPAARR